MSYRETLDFLYAQLPMYHRIGPAAFKKDLSNTLALCAHLGDPHTKFRSIHVGGTNGKGSVSHMLAAICQAAGLKTGLYISPHYKDFRERIKIDGQFIPRRQVVNFIARHRDAIERIQPSFFELCVVMAFDHFARERVDIAVIEVGLGGRLDSTNVITPLLSVITNISYDHMNMLGDTLPLIAAEKAGIIKPGIPAVIGETHPESAPVFEQKARAVNAPIWFADQHYLVREQDKKSWNTTTYAADKDGVPFLRDLEVNAGGPFQARNLATVLQAWEVLSTECPPSGRDTAEFSGEYSLPPEWSGHGRELGGGRSTEAALRAGLAQLQQRTRFQGRWQVIGDQPVVLCDSAHNEAGLQQLFLGVENLPFRALHIVTGFVNDKDVEGVLPIFPENARYYFAKADIPRGLNAAVLREKAAAHGRLGKDYASVRAALRAARRAAHPDDLIVVTGSIFVVAEVI